MVGFIEPVGTTFQSANEERMENRTSAAISSGRRSSRHNFRARARRVFVSMHRLTGSVRIPFNQAFMTVFCKSPHRIRMFPGSRLPTKTTVVVAVICQLAYRYENYCIL